MSPTKTVIPIDHHSATHEIETQTGGEDRSLTLFELTEAVSEVSESQHEAIATITYMIRSGRLSLSPGVDTKSGFHVDERGESHSISAALNLAS